MIAVSVQQEKSEEEEGVVQGFVNPWQDGDSVTPHIGGGVSASACGGFQTSLPNSNFLSSSTSEVTYVHSGWRAGACTAALNQLMCSGFFPQHSFQPYEIVITCCLYVIEIQIMSKYYMGQGINVF